MDSDASHPAAANAAGETRDRGEPRRPGPDEVWRAIDTYLRIAYAGEPPAAVRERLDQVRAAGGDPLNCPAVERRDVDGRPVRYALRLGNRLYPHMKLVVDCARPTGGDGCVFRADTHDAHCRPPEGSAEMRAYQQLVSANREIATAIEDAWTKESLPTFKGFLRRDLERRRGG